VSDYYSKPIDEFLRDPPKGYRRSAYEVEVNPWARRGEVEAALFFRGTIVSAFGYIETRIAELAIRTSRLEQYAEIRPNFPFSLEKRISYLRKVFERPPLSQFQGLAALALNRFEGAGELRHQVAHARMQVLSGSGATFEDFPKADREGIALRRGRYTMEDLEQAAWRAARLSRLCQHLMVRLDQAEILPALHV
jgi:hypothetical protein